MRDEFSMLFNLSHDGHGPDPDDYQRTLGPEQRLLLACLQDAIATLFKYRHGERKREKRLYEEEERWVALSDYDYPFSFACICTALGFDAGYVRKGLKKRLEELPPPVEGQHKNYKTRLNIVKYSSYKVEDIEGQQERHSRKMVAERRAA